MSEVAERKGGLSRGNIAALEQMIANELPPADFKVTHHFSDGIYARELFIPKGSVLTGKIHKHEHISVMSTGKLSIVTDDGTIIVEAPYHNIAPAGTKRAAYAIEDTVWTTFHVTEETDLVKIEEMFTVDSFKELDKFLGEKKCLG